MPLLSVAPSFTVFLRSTLCHLHPSPSSSRSPTLSFSLFPPFHSLHTTHRVYVCGPAATLERFARSHEFFIVSRRVLRSRSSRSSLLISLILIRRIFLFCARPPIFHARIRQSHKRGQKVVALASVENIGRAFPSSRHRSPMDRHPVCDM